MQAENDR